MSTNVNPDEFTFRNPVDDLRVDALCSEFLMEWFHALLERGTPPADASDLARSADYFLRDFVIDHRRGNIFAEKAGFIRQFAATWYIVRTLEPNRAELERHLAGVRAFYRHAAELGLVPPGFLAQVEEECDDLDYYVSRIEAFHAISGDGYIAWERECPLKEVV